MQNFMVVMQLPRFLTEEFVSLIPKHRAHINKLFEEGKITSYSLAQDRSAVWVCVPAEDADEVSALVSQFPLYTFVRVNIHALAFHEANSFVLPHISLN